MMDLPAGPAYVIKAIATWESPSDEVFKLYQLVEWAGALDADNATTILEELVRLAAHVDLAANPVHNDLVGTALSLHSFERRMEPFAPPRGGRHLLVIDLVRRYVHAHGEIIWPRRGLFEALRGLGFDVVQTRGRWRHVPYQNLWQIGALLGVYPRHPLSRLEQEQEPIRPIWTNPRSCREVVIPYVVSWQRRPLDWYRRYGSGCGCG